MNKHIIEGQLVMFLNTTTGMLDPLAIVGVVDNIEEATSFVRYAKDKYMKVPTNELFPIQNELFLVDYFSRTEEAAVQ